MNLNTQCPQCGTAFPVSMDQLQLRKGYIRCINCAAIFDGFEAIVPGTTQESGPTAKPSVPAPVPASEPIVSAPVATGPVTPVATPLPIGSSSIPIIAVSVTGAASPTSPLATSTPVAPPTVVRHRPATTARPAQQPAPYVPTNVGVSDSVGTGPVFTVPVRHAQASAASSKPDFHVGDVASPGVEPAFRVGDTSAVQEATSISVVHRRADHTPGEPIYIEARSDTRANTSGRAPPFSSEDARSGMEQAAALLWRIGLLIAVLVFVAQLVYIYRAQIASQVPTLRPMLQRACAELNCTVAYSRRIDQITIAGAALSAQQQATDEKGGAMLLQLTLRNTYNKPQEWPTLELDLNDFSGTLQVRKNIGPDVYLTQAERLQPFAANSEKVLRLPIALNGLKINGFQVRKFFP